MCLHRKASGGGLIDYMPLEFTDYLTCSQWVARIKHYVKILQLGLNVSIHFVYKVCKMDFYGDSISKIKKKKKKKILSIDAQIISPLKLCKTKKFHVKLGLFTAKEPLHGIPFPCQHDFTLKCC